MLKRYSLRLAHLLWEVLAGLAVLGLVLAGGLAWRLSKGPIDVTWFARRIEAAIAADGTRVAVHSAALAWEGFQALDAPVDIRLTGLSVTDPAGTVLLRVPRAALFLAPDELVLGRIVPRTLEVEGASLRLIRAADGGIRLDTGMAQSNAPAAGAGMGARMGAMGGGTAADPLSEFRTPARGQATGGSALSQLHHVLIRDLRVTVEDQQLGATWAVEHASADFRRLRRGGLTGRAELPLRLGDLSASLTLDGSLPRQSGESARLRARLSPVSPAALARAAPRLAGLAAFDAPVALDLTLDLTDALRPAHFSLVAESGAGTARAGRGTVPLKAATLRLSGTPEAATLDELTLALTPPPNVAAGPVLHASGSARREAGQIRATLSLDVDRVPFADLARYWPEGAGGGARPWLVRNVTAGVAHDGHFNVSLEAPEDFSTVNPTAASGTLEANDLTLHWLRPVPPIEHANAHLVLESPDALTITTQGGRQGGLTVSGGTMRVVGMMTPHQVALLDLRIEGGLANVITLLRHPRLRLLSRQPFTFADPAGDASARLTVRLPLENNVDMDMIALRADATLAGVHLGDVAAGRDLDNGQLHLTVDNNGLQLTGDAALSGIPAKLTAAMDFRAGPPGQVLQRIKVSGRANQRQAAAAGLDLIGIMDGEAALDATYEGRRGGTASLLVDADLTPARLTVPLGWSKQAGEAAHATLRLRLDHDRLTGIEDIAASGPGLDVRSHVEAVGGKPSRLLLDRVVLGQTRGSGSIAFPQRPGEPVRARLSGPVLDLAAQFAHGGDATPAKPRDRAAAQKPGAPWVVDANFDRVQLANGVALPGLVAHMENDGLHMRAARIQCGRPETLVRATLAGDGKARRLAISAANAGVVLRGTDVIHTIEGGGLALDGVYDDSVAGSPLTGTARLTEFRVRDAPVMGRLLQAMTLYGMTDVLRGPGLRFSRLEAPFRLDDDVLELRDARAFSPSLGMTVRGTIDLAAHSADLQGTIVPAYFFNQLLGNVPLVGRLFSPERGGGVFAATFTVHGSLKDPVVRVNPLAALTPGFLRGVFGIFD